MNYYKSQKEEVLKELNTSNAGLTNAEAKQRLQKNGQNINEEDIYTIIDQCVQKAKKYPFKQVYEVYITRNELQFIENLNDIKQEKIAFVLLASAKYYDAVRGIKKNTAYMRNSDICKLARVTIPVKDRDIFMQFAYDKSVLLRHNRAASIEKTVGFISNDENDDIVLKLKENDFKDLAYTYLAYKTPHKFRRCVVCGGWMKRDSKNRQVCTECSEKEDVEKNTMKLVTCIDCGKTVYADIHNKRVCRCEECQEKKTKEQKRDWWNKNYGTTE